MPGNVQVKKIIIRPADVADAPAISAVHRSNIERWQIEDGLDRRPARYADLTPYQRWLHGGAWMDAETCAYHLGRLIHGGGIALVAEVDGRVLAEAELHPAIEPPPFGRTLNLSVLYVHRNHQRGGLGSALMEHALKLAEDCDTFTVSHAEAPDFYKKYGLKLAARYKRFQLPTRTGKERYTTEPLPDVDYELVRGYALPIGRYQNAHHDWERVRPNAAPDFPEWQRLRLERWWMAVRGQRAALIFEEQQAGTANTFLFTPSPLGDFSDGGRVGMGVLSAIRDLAARSGFTHLHCFARADLKLPGAVATDYSQQLFMKRL